MRAPDAVLAFVGDADWSQDHEGRSGGVWRTTGAAGTHYVKHGPDAELEHQRLSWLAGRVPVPTVLATAGTGMDRWLVLADVGAPSLESAPPTDSATTGTVLGGLLRRLHALPLADCPFDARVATAVAAAERAVAEGLVDADDFDDENRGATPKELLERLVARQPADADLVVTHGDFTTENVLWRPDSGAVLIDLPRLGVADRHRDLALAHRALAGEPGALAAFHAAYGHDAPADEDRLRWYQLLDEFL